MYRKILVPLDGTRNDEVVLDHVRRLAKEMGSALVLIMVYRIIKDDDPFTQSMQMEEGSHGYKAREKAKIYLPELERSIAGEGISVSTEFVIADGPEADAIVKYADDKGCDMIALTNQARNGLGRWFFSNIEERVKRRSLLPVLLVARRSNKEKNR